MFHSSHLSSRRQLLQEIACLRAYWQDFCDDCYENIPLWAINLLADWPSWSTETVARFVESVINDSEPWSPDDAMDAMSSSSGYISPLSRDLLRGQRQLQEAAESEDELQQDIMVEPDAASVLQTLPPLHSLRLMSPEMLPR